MEKGKVVFLYGTSSSGKTTLAKTIQEIHDEEFFHIQLDTFLDMIHEKFYDKDFSSTENVAATTMHNFIASLSANGYNSIVDTVIVNEREEWLKECVELLHDLPIIFVKVNCPLHELERREKERGDRNIGQAKWQLANMDFNSIYDIEVDTYEDSIKECANKILNKMNSMEPECAFQKLYLEYNN